SFKIGRWIVECDVRVLANAEERDVHGRRCQMRAHSPNDLQRISGVTVEQMVIHDSGFPPQLLQQHFAKTSRMRHRQADVFVEMKSFYAGPVDPRRPRQSIQQLEM